MRILIVGAGKVGYTLTQMLAAEDHEVTVIDSKMKVLEHLQEECDVMAVHGHGASRRVLEEADAAEADLLIAVTNADEVNLLSCLLAKKLGTQNTIARVRSMEYADDMELLREELGLALTVNPEIACAHEIFRLLQLPSFLSREPFAQGRVEIVRMKVCAGSPLCGIALSGLYQAAQVHVLVCAVDRDGTVTIPDGNFVLQEGDEVFLTAAANKLAALVKNLALDDRKTTQVTIVGGSLLGYYLGHLLLRSHVGVKIIEQDPERCEVLCEKLPDADIVQGDGTDQEVLLSEGAGRADALVALTGMDEENIVLSLYARRLGVRTTITKCNRTQYTQMFAKMGLDTVVSPKMNCAEEIVRYVRAMGNSVGSQMITLHHIAGGQVEAMEFRADASSRLLDIPLAGLSLKKGLLIACLIRGQKPIIPGGADTIKAGDNVVVVAKEGRSFLDLDDILAGDVPGANLDDLNFSN